MPTEEHNILVVGETGSGKSTFINFICNYFREGSLQNLKVAIPTRWLQATEPEGKLAIETNLGMGHSRTDGVVIYKFQKNIQGVYHVFNFLDTPGLSDTRGIKQDEKNVQKILAACSELESLRTIILVQNATQGRATFTMQNSMMRLAGNIPDAYCADMILMLTQQWGEGCNFSFGSLPFEPKDGNIFIMNNTAFSQNPTLWNNQSRKSLQVDWDRAKKVMDKLLKKIVSLKAKPLSDFKAMQLERKKVQAILHDARLQMCELQKFSDLLGAAEKDLKNFEGDEKKFQDYTRKKTVTKTELVDAEYHSTICSTCNHICHEKCGLHEIPTQGAPDFTSCWALRGEECTVCSGHCSYKVHYHGKKAMKITEISMEEILQEIKDKYDEATKGKGSKLSEMTTLDESKTVVEATIKNMATSMIDACQNIQKLCRNFNLVEELTITLGQLETEASLLTSATARKQADEFIRSINVLIDKLSREGVKPKPAKIWKADNLLYRDDEDEAEVKRKAPDAKESPVNQRSKKNSKDADPDLEIDLKLELYDLNFEIHDLKLKLLWVNLQNQGLAARRGAEILDRDLQK